MQNLSFDSPPSLAIAEDVTTPNPGKLGVTVWSSTLSKLVIWNGSKWRPIDPWTYVVLAADFSTNSATDVDVTGMAFTSSVNKRYLIEGNLFGRSEYATAGVQIGIVWPTVLIDSMAEIRMLTSNSGSAIADVSDIAGAFSVISTGVGSTNGGWPMTFSATMITGSSLTNNTFKLQLSSEVSGISVTLRAGSWIRYRTY